jgi:hypothetical protein
VLGPCKAATTLRQPDSLQNFVARHALVCLAGVFMWPQLRASTVAATYPGAGHMPVAPSLAPLARAGSGQEGHASESLPKELCFPITFFESATGITLRTAVTGDVSLAAGQSEIRALSHPFPPFFVWATPRR